MNEGPIEAAVGSDPETDSSGFGLMLINHGAEVVMVLGGVVAYIPQYLHIKRTGNHKGFSLHVCLTLIVANTLRILFWFGRHYERPLLLQSILMNAAMMELIRLCVAVDAKRSTEYLTGAAPKERTFIDFDWRHFWRWTDFQSYVEAVTSFTAVCSLAMFLLLNVDPFVETVGFLAVFTEALLGMPQLWQNYKNGSTYGMSLQMVIMWTSGDTFKTTYFVLRKAPVQFGICGAWQLAIDIAILGQVWLYRHNTAKQKKSDMDVHHY